MIYKVSSRFLSYLALPKFREAGNLDHFVAVSCYTCPRIRTCPFTIGIKHGSSCINIRQVQREVLKTEAEGRGFQHLPRDLANINALKNHV